MRIESNNSLSDSDKILAIAGLFKGNFSIDWFIDLLTEKKSSPILAQLEECVKAFRTEVALRC
jgi:hypothetical protein